MEKTIWTGSISTSWRTHLGLTSERSRVISLLSIQNPDLAAALSSTECTKDAQGTMAGWWSLEGVVDGSNQSPTMPFSTAKWMDIPTGTKTVREIVVTCHLQGTIGSPTLRPNPGCKCDHERGIYWYVRQTNRRNTLKFLWIFHSISSFDFW